MEDDGIIRLNFMKELCRRDDEANKRQITILVPTITYSV
jgi:hypothetical protein